MNPDPWLIEITVLKITQTSERFLKLEYLSPANGLDYGLLRFSPKNQKTLRPDLFDTAEVHFEGAGQSPSKQHFLDSYSPLRKRDAIGHSYPLLHSASQFAQFLLDNARHAPDPEEIYQLCLRSFDAFNQVHEQAQLKQPKQNQVDSPKKTQAELAQIILLKALYHFLKIEGFPVDNAWWQSIPTAEKALAESILRTPLSESSPTPCQYLLSHLSQWIRRETELSIEAL